MARVQKTIAFAHAAAVIGLLEILLPNYDDSNEEMIIYLSALSVKRMTGYHLSDCVSGRCCNLLGGKLSEPLTLEIGIYEISIQPLFTQLKVSSVTRMTTLSLKKRWLIWSVGLQLDHIQHDNVCNAS